MEKKKIIVTGLATTIGLLIGGVAIATALTTPTDASAEVSQTTQENGTLAYISQAIESGEKSAEDFAAVVQYMSENGGNDKVIVADKFVTADLSKEDAGGFFGGETYRENPNATTIGEVKELLRTYGADV